MKHILFTIITLISIQIDAQYRLDLLPRSSPDRGVYEKVGYTDVEITYGSPRVNDRKIWGNLVPYGKVWRAGANNATKIDFQHDVEILGNILPAGKYALFLIPQKSGDWQVIFNGDYSQWGAFNYDESLNVLSVGVPVKKCDYHEGLTYAIEGKDYDKGEIIMSWEKKRIVIPFSTQYINMLTEEVDLLTSQSEDENLASVIYLQGAEYLEGTESNLPLASEWINNALNKFKLEGEWNSQFYPKHYIYGHMLWTKAKILALEGEFTTAVLFAEKMKTLEGEFSYYQEEKDYEQIDEIVDYWKSL